MSDFTIDEFERYKSIINDDTLIRRTRHAVYENQRTINAMKSLQADDMVEFGELMMESHISLKNDYEVTGLHLDTLYESAIRQEGVIGARMTGAALEDVRSILWT